jgi:flagellar biosynthetic protein FlhB
VSEERSVDPSPKRRQEARERGDVARSPILTAGAGLLAGWIGLKVWGGSLAAAFREAIHAPWSGPVLVPDVGSIAATIRAASVAIAAPILGILLLTTAVMAACHLAQTGLSWTPSLLAPDLARLWRFRGREGGSEGISGGIGRGLWALVRGFLLIAIAGGVLIRDASAYHSLATLPLDTLADSAGGLVLRLLGAFALAVVVLGGLDFALQWRRHEDRLRQTPEQQRQDLIASEGNPAFRSQRRRLLRSGNPQLLESLAGASWVLLGGKGLTLVIAGGPLPRPIQVRAVARGTLGASLQSIARATKLPAVAAPELAGRLAASREESPGRPLSPSDAASLAAIWPVGAGRGAGEAPGGSVS